MYEFKRRDAYDFASYRGIEARERGGELHFKYCPICSGGRSRDKETFAIDLSTGQCKCLRTSCGYTGNMITLANDFDFSLGEADEYIAPKKQYRKLKTPAEPIKPKDKAIEYLRNRGISERVAKEYEITVQNGHDNILVFPFYDENGILLFAKYRKTDFDSSRDKNKEWCEKGCKPILFGMKQCKDFKRLIVTEGQLDSLSVAEAGLDNAVSVPTGANGYTWVPYCWNWVNRFEEIVIFGDCEKGKITLLDDFRQRFHKKIRYVPEEYYKGCKDANEILQKYGAKAVKQAVEHAAQIPVQRVISLADVKKVNIYDIPKLKTGISKLDMLLCGGLPFGQMHIISGKRGDGKSTLASQIISNAIEQGYKTFSYSGELPNHLFKMWMDLQIAGSSNIYEKNTFSSTPSYFITNTVSEKINEWYRDKAYLFDSAIIDGDEMTSLPEIIEQSIMQYDTKVILIDNLMTAIELESSRSSDKYERQGHFINKLVGLVLKYNVLILLVAHKRKNSFTKDTNDEVSGAGEITNYAGVVMSYDRDTELNDTERKLVVSKNRLTGKLNTKGLFLEYEEKSKRIYGDGDDVNFQFGWNNNAYEFVPAEEETPFD